MRGIAFFLLFILLLQSAASATLILNYTEGDSIKLQPVATDSDGDRLTYFFKPPLSGKGEWQTRYGDQGTYHSQITVSDGRLTSSRNITLTIAKKEELPTIELVSPDKREFYLLEGESTLFTLRASDLNKDPVSVDWVLDGKPVAEGNYFLYEPDYYSEGEHKVAAMVSDGFGEVPIIWDVEVGDVDRAALLDDFKSVTFNETETLTLPLPDFSAYDLRYTISEPVGNDGVWQTTYEDAGVYVINLSIFDEKEFREEKQIHLLVENVNRPPQLTSPAEAKGREGEEIVIPVNFIDPDGELVQVEVQGLPEGASFDGSTFTWIPGYDVVVPTSTIERVARNYHLMDKVVRVNFTATDGEITNTQGIDLRVFNTNRAPRILSASDIKVSEGESVFVTFDAIDPDGDTITYSLDGYITKNGQAANGVGSHLVRLTVTDGLLTVEKHVRISVLAQEKAPMLTDLPVLSVAEGEKLIEKFSMVHAKTLSIDPMPEGAELIGNTLTWIPPYNEVDEDTSYNLTVTASDENGKSDKRNITLLVRNTNTVPQTLESSQHDGKTFFTGEAITFRIKARDLDYDELSYLWTADDTIQEVTQESATLSFARPGKKVVTVSVSDGVNTFLRVWEVIIERAPGIRLLPAKPMPPLSQPVIKQQIVQQPTQTVTEVVPKARPAQPVAQPLKFTVVHSGDAQVSAAVQDTYDTVSFEIQ